METAATAVWAGIYELRVHKQNHQQGGNCCFHDVFLFLLKSNNKCNDITAKGNISSSQNVYPFLLELAEFVGNSMQRVHVLNVLHI